jgi:addiction module HigA family antidote
MPKFGDFLNAPPNPGSVIKVRIDVSGIKQADLARALGVSAPRLNMILKNRLHITPEIALRLAKVFGTSPFYWLQIRADFEIFVESRRLSNELNEIVSLQARHEHGERQALAA